MFHQPQNINNAPDIFYDLPRLYRALVTYSNEHTGEIKVRVPALLGGESEVSISYIGRSARNDFWVVPAIGSQIVISSDDKNLTNVFWIRTDEVKNRHYNLSVYDTTTQTTTMNGGTGVAQAVTFNNTITQEGINLLNNRSIIFAHTGTYNIQFSLQFKNANTSRPYDAVAWFRHNGSDISHSSSYITVPERKNSVDGKNLMTVNFVDTFHYNDYVELWWAAQSADVSIATISSETLIPAVPVSPGVIVTVTQVG